MLGLDEEVEAPGGVDSMDIQSHASVLGAGNNVCGDFLGLGARALRDDFEVEVDGAVACAEGSVDVNGLFVLALAPDVVPLLATSPALRKRGRRERGIDEVGACRE